MAMAFAQTAKPQMHKSRGTGVTTAAMAMAFVQTGKVANAQIARHLCNKRGNGNGFCANWQSGKCTNREAPV